MTRMPCTTAMFACAIVLPTPAFAGSSNSVMAVTASVAQTCTVAATPLAFGQLSLSGGTNDTQATVALVCTPGVVYNVGMDAGTHASGGTRHMAGTVGGSTLPYSLYANAARTIPWGNTVGTDTVSGTATNGAETLTVYGRVPQAPSLFVAGGYTDTVTVTVTF